MWWRWLWRIPYSGILCRVAPVRGDVSKEHSSSIIRLTRIGVLGTMFPLTSNRRPLRGYTMHYYVYYVLGLTTVGNPPRWPRDTPLSAKVGTKLRRQVAVAQSVLFACRLKAAEFYVYCVFIHNMRRLLVTANIVPSSPILVTLIMEALCCFETSVHTRATCRHIPEDGILRLLKIFVGFLTIDLLTVFISQFCFESKPNWFFWKPFREM
jgi:hypothetical protein